MKSHHWLYFIIATALAVVAFAVPSIAVDITSDWDVAGHTPMSSDTVNVYGNITVPSGGWLDLTNIDMVMKCTVDGQYTIKVANGGKLTFNGGTLSADNPMYRYAVELRGSATIEGVTITNTWGTGPTFNAGARVDPDLSGLKGGVQIYSDDVYIGNCTLKQGMLCMVYVSGASPTLFGNTIEDVEYYVGHYSQTTGEPSDTKWSAVAIGVLLDNAPARLDTNTFSRVGAFSTLESVFYRDSSNNTNEYQVIAAAVASRGGVPKVLSSAITDTGSLTRTSQSFTDGGNVVNQRFFQYRVAGIYAYRAEGSDFRTNTISSSVYGMYIIISPSASGGPMTFDVIIDNVIKRNSMGG